MILFGEASLHRAISNYVDHHHTGRPHQGVGNVMIDGQIQAGDRERPEP